MKEIRYLPVEDMRAVDANGKRTIAGYAAVFYKMSENLGGFREKIAKGAFRTSVASGDVRAFWSHNVDIILGRTKANTLRINEDEYGLAFELDLPDTQAGRDAFVSINRGDVTAMSFGFNTITDKWDRSADGTPHTRTLLDVELLEVSPVAFPAYPQTSVNTRALSELLTEQEKKWLTEDKENSLNLNKDQLAQKRQALESKFAKNRFIKLANLKEF
jgi:HK97 family phage prohead protease